MARYKERPRTVNADQWFKNGDHPKDGTDRFTEGPFKGELLEGKVVRYFRRPDVHGTMPCQDCGQPVHNHGWIDLGTSGLTVCPGDVIVTKDDGTYEVLKEAVFNRRYERDRSYHA